MQTILNANLNCFSRSLSLIYLFYLLTACSSHEQAAQDIGTSVPTQQGTNLTNEEALKILQNSESFSLQTTLFALNLLSHKLALGGQYFAVILNCAQSSAIQPQLHAACLLSLGRTPWNSLSPETQAKLRQVVWTQLQRESGPDRLGASIVLVRLPQLLTSEDHTLLYAQLPKLRGPHLAVQIELLKVIQSRFSQSNASIAKAQALALAPLLVPSLVSPYTLRSGAELLQDLDMVEFRSWLNLRCLPGEIAARRFQCWRVLASLHVSPKLEAQSSTAQTTTSPLWNLYKNIEPQNAAILEGDSR